MTTGRSISFSTLSAVFLGLSGVFLSSALAGQLDRSFMVETFAVGYSPEALVFDGENIWVSNYGLSGGTVTKLRASDGFWLGEFPAGNTPLSITYDGTNIWVGNFADATLTKLRASDGAILGTFPVGKFPSHLVFDGANIWLTNAGGSNTIQKVRASDGVVLATFAVGPALSLLFDGENIWVTNYVEGALIKLRASDGMELAKVPIDCGSGQFGPLNLAYDGANIWATCPISMTILRASDATILFTLSFNLPGTGSLAFDGHRIWATNSPLGITLLRAKDGVHAGRVKLPDDPDEIIFDGTSIWAILPLPNKVCKITLQRGQTVDEQ